MRVRVDGISIHYVIDDEVGKLFKVCFDEVKNGKSKKSKIIERLWSWKAIKTIGEGFSYISEVEGIPVYKLRTMSKKEEGKK